MNKVPLYYKEETYTLCVTRDDCWLEDGPSDYSERLMRAMEEVALENGMAPDPNWCQPCFEKGIRSYVHEETKPHTLTFNDGTTEVLPAIKRRVCRKCGWQTFPWPEAEKIGEAQERHIQLACEAGKGAKRP